MHPIERLRYVARSQGGDQRTLVEETAGALRGLGLDPAGLVVACRRILERHPSSGPLWWLCSSVLGSSDPLGTARRLAYEIDDDPTADRLIDALPADATVCLAGWPDLVGEALIRRGDLRALVVDTDDGPSFVRRLQRSEVAAELLPAAGVAAAAALADVALVEALAATPVSLIVPRGSASVGAAAYCAGVPVWAVVGRGRRLPQRAFDVLVQRSIDAEHPWESPVETMPTDLVTAVVGPDGHRPLAGASFEAECPLASELLRSSAM